MQWDPHGIQPVCCEYDIIPGYMEEVEEFKQLLIEYHHGYNGILSHLTRAGFKCVDYKPPQHKGDTSVLICSK
ncbi:hypothetical protein [Desulfurococcus mucosus]|uniref:hypothetical protein n=1 Tax=Desulfurococcus mucosus TaxID=2275 RepID=UPI000AED4B10|nr:hypothetical protein [Desulfurococcus mucosus]